MAKLNIDGREVRRRSGNNNLKINQPDKHIFFQGSCVCVYIYLFILYWDSTVLMLAQSLPNMQKAQ